jgi:hypothetical protein
MRGGWWKTDLLRNYWIGRADGSGRCGKIIIPDREGLCLQWTLQSLQFKIGLPSEYIDYIRALENALGIIWCVVLSHEKKQLPFLNYGAGSHRDRKKYHQIEEFNYDYSKLKIKGKEKESNVSYFIINTGVYVR